MRNHSSALQFTDKLFEIFCDETVGWDAARAIGEVAGVDDVLTKKHHAVIRVGNYIWVSWQELMAFWQILYAQKFVNRVLPKVIAGAKDSSSK